MCRHLRAFSSVLCRQTAKAAIDSRMFHRVVTTSRRAWSICPPIFRGPRVLVVRKQSTSRPATNAIRNELEPKIQKSVPLTNIRSAQEIVDIINTLRQILLTQSAPVPNSASNAIELDETAEKVALAEALIRAL